MSYICKSISGLFEDMSDFISKAAQDTIGFQKTQEEAKALISEYNKLDKDFRVLYSSCDQLMQAIRKINFDNGEMLRHALNTYQVQFDKIYYGIRDTNYIEDIEEYIKQLKTLYNNLQNFQKQMQIIINKPYDEVKKMIPESSLDKISGSVKFVIVGAVAFGIIGILSKIIHGKNKS